MEYITPKVYHVAATELLPNLVDYLSEIGAGDDWLESHKESGAETLIEVAGRLCYRSFKAGLNLNVTKVREGNKEYLGNVLSQKHGSVFEHPCDSYIFHNISRVFTHELVRHRAGCGYSQESLRYVRLDKLRCWYPRTFEELPDAAHRDDLSLQEAKIKLKLIWERVFSVLEGAQVEMADVLGIDRLKNFGLKKMLTSAMRRLAPLGLATDILMTANHRAWRHLISLRTSRHAEEEIRMVFAEVYNQQAKRYPNIYQDAKTELVDGALEVTFANEKV